MYSFYIEVDRDEDAIKEILPLHFYIPYIKATQPLYNLLVGKISLKKLKEYKPEKDGNRVKYTQESESLEELEKEKEELEKWLFSNKDELNKDERIKRAFNLRFVKYAMNKLAVKMLISINKANTVLEVFNMNGITITYGIK